MQSIDNRYMIIGIWCIFFSINMFAINDPLSSNSSSLEQFMQNDKDNESTDSKREKELDLKTQSTSMTTFIYHNADEAINSENNLSTKPIEDESINNNQTAPQSAYKKYIWNEFMDPWSIFEDEGSVYINFNNTDLVNVLKYFEDIYKVIFITDDIINPVPQAGKSLLGSKVNFSTNSPLSRREAWNVLMTLLEIVGVTLQPGSMYRTYRVVSLMKDSPMGYTKGPLPVYIGVPIESLPESDMRIRYVYQVQNTSLEAVKNIAKSMQSASSPDPIDISEIYSVMITDRVYNIKTIISVIQELDKITMPEIMSIIKLKKTDATKLIELYKNIIKDDSNPQNQSQPRMLGPKRTDTLNYFDANLKIIPDPRTNTLIVLGTAHSIKKFEEFVQECEKQINQLPYIPSRIYRLQFTQAEAVAKILEQALTFKTNTDFSKLGGVRDGDKYISNINLVAEPLTNSLIITGPDEEYDYIYKLIKEIDIEQPQVGLDVMIVSVDITKTKALGTQLRNKQGLFGNSINAQAGLIDTKTGIVADYTKDSNGNIGNGSGRLMGDLMTLITGNAQPSGVTAITLGNDQNGVWGLIRMLQTETEAKVISNPYLVTTNKYEATMNIGEVRRIAATKITNDNNSSQSFTSDDAKIQVKITPQISDSGMITMNIYIETSQFENPDTTDAVAAGNKNTRSILTSALVPNGEIVALGGLIYESVNEVTREVPWLGKIPIIGWLFKNKEFEKVKKVMIIFIRPTIMHGSTVKNNINIHEKAKYEIKEHLEKTLTDVKCPINRWFFAEPGKTQLSYTYLEKFMDESTTEASSKRGTLSKEEIYA
jgi:general secretion pathway protein D